MRSVFSDEARDVPAYTVPEASRYLAIPVSTLSSWVAGRIYPPGHGRRKQRFDPVVEIADPVSRTLSFTNLVEAHVLNGLRKERRIKLETIRQAVQMLRKDLG